MFELELEFDSGLNFVIKFSPTHNFHDGIRLEKYLLIMYLSLNLVRETHKYDLNLIQLLAIAVSQVQTCLWARGSNSWFWTFFFFPHVLTTAPLWACNQFIRYEYAYDESETNVLAFALSLIIFEFSWTKVETK